MHIQPKHFLVLGVLIMLASCVTQIQPQMTQLQIRELQTRTYATTNTKMVMKAVLNALQDMGFTITNAQENLGLIVAVENKDVENKTAAMFEQIFAGYHARYAKDAITHATANISPYGKVTMVRVSFTVKVLDNKGGVVRILHIANAKIYQKFFAKIQQSIYLQEQKVG